MLLVEERVVEDMRESYEGASVSYINGSAHAHTCPRERMQRVSRAGRYKSGSSHQKTEGWDLRF